MALTGPGCHESDGEKVLGEDDLEDGFDGSLKKGEGEKGHWDRDL